MQAHTRLRMTSGRRKVKTHTNPSSGLDGTTRPCYWYSNHTHSCSCRHTLAHVWRVLEGMQVWKIENTRKSIIRARLNKTNLLLMQQTYTHLLVQAHARSRMTSARRHACMKNWKHTQIHHQGYMEQHKLVIDSAYKHTSARASTRSLMYDERTKACMYEKLKTHTNPSSGLDWTTQTCYWYSKHTHICSCKHMLAQVWRVHKGMHVWKIAKTLKSIIRARWNNTNLLLIQQTYTHLLLQAHACSSMTSAQSHVCMKNCKDTQIHHQG